MMRQPLVDSQSPRWPILSTYVRLRDGPRRVEQAFRILLGSPRPPEASTPSEGRSDYACSALRPRLDRSPGTRPND
jgi:hypothetical protein